MNTSAGIYVHFPFCASKCNYCGFYTIPDNSAKIQEYLNALTKEMAMQSPKAKNLLIDTIFLGGGTPSLMTHRQLEKIFSDLEKYFVLSEKMEITLEANPTSITKKKSTELYATPINRISFGCQSFDKGLLKLLGRNHQPEDSERIFFLFREAGFANISIDLIFSIPGQSMTQWLDSLQKVLDLRPEHVSLYCLSYEDGTRFKNLLKKGSLTPLDEDTELAMFQNCIEILTSAGYIHYEISNFALPGYESKHNTLYWKNLPCVGLGTSAFSFINGDRFQTIPHVQNYISSLQNPHPQIYCNRENLSEENSLHETTALNVRLIHEGIDLNELQQKYPDLDVSKILLPIIHNLINEQLLEEAESEKFLLTSKGIHFADYIATELL